MPGREDMPSTIRRSPKEAQRTWAKTHDSAVEQYGEGRRAHQTAFAALKHKFEKVGDRWAPKKSKGPSDPQAERGAGQRPTQTGGGVDVHASKQHLYDRAQDLGIKGRSKMSKQQLVDAIQKENRQRTRQARSR
ncbi:MAG: cation transport regulator ChaB [Streptosporangiales bacterium]|nr:cation transport regulator ChaB [Streptosporangiales bacterium]